MAHAALAHIMATKCNVYAMKKPSARFQWPGPTSHDLKIPITNHAKSITAKRIKLAQRRQNGTLLAKTPRPQATQLHLGLELLQVNYLTQSLHPLRLSSAQKHNGKWSIILNGDSHTPGFENQSPLICPMLLAPLPDNKILFPTTPELDGNKQPHQITYSLTAPDDLSSSEDNKDDNYDFT
jgi:hypothetical protein